MASGSSLRLAGCSFDFILYAGEEVTIEVPADKRLVLVGYGLSSEEGAACTIADGTSTLSVEAKPFATYAGGVGAPAFEFAKGEPVTVSGSVSGHLTYVLR